MPIDASAERAASILFAQGRGRFRRFEDFLPEPDSYRLLPFRIHHMQDGRYLISNEAGQYLLIMPVELELLVTGNLSPTSVVYQDLSSRHFLLDKTNHSAIDLLAIKTRTKRDIVASFTALHMFVLTLRCNQSCPYCQVSRQSEDRAAFDMSPDHIEKALDLTFRSPSPIIKIEFQGGEPLLNFDGIKQAVAGAKKRNAEAKKRLEIVIATNLTVLDDSILSYLREEGIYISTSLDGPEDLHNANRPYKDRNAHKSVRRNIERAREALGPDSVSALMTTTAGSLGRVTEIIDEYLDAGMSEIFLRALSPYGFALKTQTYHEYDSTDWIQFFKKGVEYILHINRRGTPFREIYSSILLRKLLTPHGTGFVNLQSPAGVGIAGIIYNYDGAIYGSDEGRMLAEMQDSAMKLGHLDASSYQDVFMSERLFQILSESLPESSPMCHDCGLLPYCGSDPDYHYSRQGDFRGHKALSGFCQKNMAIIEWLIGKVEAGGADADILRTWAR